MFSGALDSSDLLSSHPTVALTSHTTTTHNTNIHPSTSPRPSKCHTAAISFVNFCDESFNLFLNDRIAEANSEEAKQRLGKVRYEINSARQQKLMVADQILRGILAAGGLKQVS